MVQSLTALRLIVEAAGAAGIPERVLLAGMSTEPSARVDWDDLVEVIDRLSSRVDGDPERLRSVGGNIVRTRGYEFLKRLAGQMVSLESVYVAGWKWVAPALFPHLPLEVSIRDERRIRFEGSIPAPHAGSAPFFHVFEGCVRELPTLLDQPPAKIVLSEVTARRVVMELELPPSPSLRARLRHSLRAAVGGRDRLELLERQREELQRSIEEMRRVTDEFERLLDGLPDPVAIHRDGIMLWVNRILLETLGYSDASEVVGKPVINMIHESSVAEALAHMRMPIGSQPERVEMRLRRRNGEIVIAEMSPAQSIIFGGLEARLVVGRDVTERVRMQERLVTADRLSSLGLLAAGVAHEINNPLAYVLGSIENARRCIDGPAPNVEQAREALSTALEGVDRVRAIIRDLGVLSRADESSMQAVDVRTVLDSTLTLAGREIEGRARIVRDYRPVPDARVNAARLGQVFLNLMVNALESMPEESADENELRVRTSTDSAGKPVIEVSDTGTGIPPELVSRIFDPFFTTKRDGRGTGLGLAICHRIIAEAGGDITVDSAPGRGSTFRLTLIPASPPDPPEVPARS